jgi:hypothetical protein
MKLVYACSPSHDVLKKYFFLGTLCEPWELMEIRYKMSGEGNMYTPAWNHIVGDRIAALLQIVKDHPGEVIVHADVDIQWFKPAQPAILEALQDRDIVFQRGSYQREIANAGFFALRSNPATIALLEQEVIAIRSGTMDQKYINDLIRDEKMPCRYGFLPNTFFHDYLEGPPTLANGELILYHSANTPVRDGKTSVQIKLERQLDFRARVIGSHSMLVSTPHAPSASIPPKSLVPSAF